MPLFLCDLAPLLGKDEDTLARWCERGGVIPGAYRTRGGSKRRGKWRVAVPIISLEDVSFARARSRRDGIAVDQYVGLLTLDRLCNRIAENSKRFARSRSRKAEAAKNWREFIGRESADLAERGIRVGAFDLQRFNRDYAIGATRLIAGRKNPARAATDAIALQLKGKASRSPQELRSYGSMAETDPTYALACALAADAHKSGDASRLTLQGLAQQFGLSRGQLYRRPELAHTLRRALRAAGGYARALATKDAADPNALENRELLRSIKKQDGALASDGAQDRAMHPEYERWVLGMSPAELKAALAAPHVRGVISKAIARINAKKNRDKSAF